MANIFNSVLNASFWGGGLTLLCLLFNKVFKKSLPAYWHYYIWIIVIIRLLVPTVVVNIESNENFIINKMPAVINQEELNTNAVPDIGYEEPIFAGEHYNQTDKQINVSTTILSVFVYFWMPWLTIVILIILIKILSNFYYTKNLLKHRLSLNERELHIFEEQKMALNIKRKIRTLKTDTVFTPFTMGCFKSMIILPNKEFTDIQLIYIFHHELMHIKRNDIALKWLFEIVKSLHWFNPFIYIASKRFSYYCEISCDEAVLKNSSLEERKEYGLTVIDVINQAVNPKTTICVSMSNNKSDLQQRIHHILNCERHKKNISLTIIVSLLALLLCACSGIKVENSQTTALAPTSTIENIKTNFLIVGQDGNTGVGRADVIMVANFNSETNKLSLLSIPKDTYLSPSDETISALGEDGVQIPKEIKFGEMLVYSDGNINYLQNEIKNAFGISTDYYVKMNMSALEKMVDTIGGIEMTIADGGLYYSDPYQNLEIALDEGTQLLDGKKALMLLRYRKTYPNGDLDRIVVQQDFIKKLYSKVVDGDRALDKITDLIPVLIENTETNLTMTDFMLFTPFVSKMSEKSITTSTLPIKMERIDNRLFAIPTTVPIVW